MLNASGEMVFFSVSLRANNSLNPVTPADSLYFVLQVTLFPA